jgi:hypothetical protein
VRGIFVIGALSQERHEPIVLGEKKQEPIGSLH